MLLTPYSQLGGLELPFAPGDSINLNEQPVVAALDAVYTFTGLDLAAGDVYRTLMSAGRADVLPTAQQLIDALRGNYNAVTPPGNELFGLQPNRSVNLAWPANVMPFMPGTSLRRKIFATTAFALTIGVPANGGMVAAAAPWATLTVSASTWREFLFQILNSSPTTVIPVGQTTGTKPLIVSASNIDAINNITPGMSAYGTNIAASTKVAAVNRDTGVITLDTNVTATLSNNPVTFTPTVLVYGLSSGTL